MLLESWQLRAIPTVLGSLFHAHHPLVQNLFLTHTCPSPDTAEQMHMEATWMHVLSYQKHAGTSIAAESPSVQMLLCRIRHLSQSKLYLQEADASTCTSAFKSGFA